MNKSFDNTLDIAKLSEQAESKLLHLQQKVEKEHALLAKMQQTFEQNIAAFKQYLPDVLEQLADFDSSKLQFICAESGDANLIDLESGKPLYNADPKEQCRQQVRRNIEKPVLAKIGFNPDNDTVNDFIHSKYLSKMYNLFLEKEQELDSLASVPEYLGSGVIFGIGLGYHIEYLLQQVTIEHLYICEPNISYFYASLYTCDWQFVLEKLDKSNGYIFLNLGVSYEDFTSDFINEMKDKGSFYAINSLMYQHYPSEALTKIVQQFSNDFHMIAIGWGFFDDGVISIAHDYANGCNQVPVLKKQAQLPKAWRNMPVFVVANGPSLDNSIQYLREIQHKVIIFSCGSAIKPLLKQQIIPDFHLEVERTKLTYDYFIRFVDLEALKKIRFLTVNVMHPSCMELFKWSGMGFKPAEPSTVISCDFIDKNQHYTQLKFSNPVVANTGTSFACYMGFEEIYLLGVDCGYKDPARHHSVDSQYYDESGNEKSAIGAMVREGEVEVEGAFGGTVYSTAFYNTGRFYMERLLDIFDKVNCYNCSDGAKIKGTIPVQPDDILLSSNLPDKAQFLDFIEKDMFLDRNFDAKLYEEMVAKEKFNEICDHMCDLLEQNFTSRQEVAEALLEQVRYLFSYSHTRYRHIYFLLEGSLTYVHSVFRMMLYGFEDEKQTLALMQQAFSIFKEYMHAAKEKYQGVLQAVDNQESKLLDLLE